MKERGEKHPIQPASSSRRYDEDNLLNKDIKLKSIRHSHVAILKRETIC